MSARFVARALAMALLADARTGVDARAWPALAARARQCLGLADPSTALPAPLDAQLQHLARLPGREWQRLEVEDLATWLQHGVWRRQAGLPAARPRADGGLIADGALDGEGGWPDADEGFDEPEDDEDAEAGDPDHAPRAFTALSPTQLATAFRTWAARSPTRVPAGPQVRHWLLRAAEAPPAPNWLHERSLLGDAAPARWATPDDVAQALGLPLDELLWLAPAHAHWRERPGHELPPSHYRFRLLPKRSGGLRLLEIAQPRLADAQRRLLALALNPVPVHEAAHGFVRGRGVASHATLHAGQAVVARFDLCDFFTQVHATRVRALWRALGHTRAVADLLTALTTVRTPAAVRERLLDATPWDDSAPATPQINQRRLRAQALARPHLPQGAPTSPAIANLCAFGLDVRLAALAERFGARYSRYADDLVISGPADLRRQWPQLRAWVGAIVQDEGFALRPDKTRLMPAHQRQLSTGLVLNTRPNLPRDSYDRLKAQLHRLRQAPAVPAAERARLLGQLQWAQQWLAPSRSAKLRALFDAIRFVG